MTTVLGQVTAPGPQDVHIEPESSQKVAHEAFPSANPESMDSRYSTVQQIAKKLSHSSLKATDANGKPIFGGDNPDSPLNPSGTKFNARLWAKNFARVAREAGQDFRRTGLCFENLSVFGYGTPADFQKDVANIWLALPGILVRRLLSSLAGSSGNIPGRKRLDILYQADGLIRPGEMCVVLGPPGSGCSTFLKTISGDRNGLYVGDGSYFNYHGIPDKEMRSAHRGDAIYTAEVDVHFPNLTVGETLTFAARARCQKELVQGISRDQ